MGISNKYSQFLSTRAFSICALLLAWINKCWLCYLNFSLVGDKSIYSLMANNAVRGNGFTETFYFLESPTQQFFFTNQSFATPGYSILLSVPLWLTSDLFLSCLIIDAAGCLLLLTGIRALLKQAGASMQTVNLATLLVGFFIYPHEFSSTPKDTLSVSLLCWALFFLIKCTSNPFPTIKSGLLPGVFFILPGLVKLNYLPFAIICPLLLFFLSYYKNERSLRKIFIGSCLSVFFIYFSIYGLLRFTSYDIPDEFIPPIYNSWRIVQDTRVFGINFENIGQMFPFVHASVINPEVTGQVLVNKCNLPFRLVNALFIWTNFSLILALLIYFIRYLLKFFKKKHDRSTMLIINGSLISIAILSITSVLAIILLPVYFKGSGVPYSYISEGRAFFFIIVFLQLVFLLRLWSRRFNLHSYWKFATYIIFTAFLLTAIHGFYYSFRNVLSGAKKDPLYIGQTFQPILNYINSIKKENPDKLVSLVTNMSHLRWLLLLSGEKVYTDAITLLKKDIPLNSNELRVVILYKEDQVVFDEYLKREDVTMLYAHGQMIIVGQGFQLK